MLNRLNHTVLTKGQVKVQNPPPSNTNMFIVKFMHSSHLSGVQFQTNDFLLKRKYYVSCRYPNFDTVGFLEKEEEKKKEKLIY